MAWTLESNRVIPATQTCVLNEILKSLLPSVQQCKLHWLQHLLTPYQNLHRMTTQPYHMSSGHWHLSGIISSELPLIKDHSGWEVERAMQPYKRRLPVLKHWGTLLGFAVSPLQTIEVAWLELHHINCPAVVNTPAGNLQAYHRYLYGWRSRFHAQLLEIAVSENQPGKTSLLLHISGGSLCWWSQSRRHVAPSHAWEWLIGRPSKTNTGAAL